MARDLIDDRERVNRIVFDHLEGEALAREALARIAREYSDGDLLLRACLNALADAGFVVPPSSRLRGFARVVQKALETGK